MMKIKILQQKWKIKEVKKRHKKLFIETGEQCAGTCFFNEKTIYICKILNSQDKRSTLKHELAHAFLWETQIQKPKEFTEEMVCEFMAIYSDIIVSITNKYFNKE